MKNKIEEKRKKDPLMSAKQRFCFFLSKEELSELKTKAKNLSLNSSEYIRESIFKSHKKSKEQYILKTVSTLSELKNILLKLSMYVQTYKSIDLYALEVLCEIDKTLSELRDDL